VSGFKAAKDHVTVMLEGNACGNRKLKSAITYHAESSRLLKGLLKSSLLFIGIP
jgi:hypothetical protein